MSSPIGRQHVARHVAGTQAARGRTVTPAAYSLAKLLLVSVVQLPLSYAAPILSKSLHTFQDEDLPKSPEDPNLWAYLGTAVALVLLGGAFAGLTIALMGQDEIYLQVIATSGEGSERKNAARVLRLLNRGKHWVLVTLLLSNVITNETLPIVLDRSLGGGWPAVVSSTVLIVIFGEIAPQSVCVRYGLPIGAWMSPFVLALMWVMAPVAWPTAKLLDWLLGADHGTVYKKAGLKTLVTLHKTIGTSPAERLNEDEVTIISAVLDLKEKPIGDIMTPMNDVFTMSADTVLDEKMMDTILSQGYSRIPIYAPENQRNFIGMLLVKILITYDPEDCMRVRDFSLATLPETAPHTSCLDIVNFFQEGKSHMVLVSDFPGEDRGALGVVTLEDVIEELIGEEIIDESDVFVDVHRAIRRIAPAPRQKYNKANVVMEPREYGGQEAEVDASESDKLIPRSEAPGLGSRKSSMNEPRETTFLMRRSSGSSTKDVRRPVAVRSNTVDMRQHLRHLGPSNVASRPKATKYTSVKIKPGVGTIPEAGVPPTETSSQPPETPRSESAIPDKKDGPGTSLLGDAAEDRLNGKAGRGYGTISGTDDTGIAIGSEEEVKKSLQAQSEPSSPPRTAAEASALAANNVSSEPVNVTPASPPPEKEQNKQQLPEKLVVPSGGSRPGSSEGPKDASREERQGSDSSESTVGELGGSRRPSRIRRAARSGSITENMVDVGGMKKLVLETNSSSDGEDAQKAGQADGTINEDDEEGELQNGHDGGHDGDQNDANKKKKRRKRGGKKVREREAHKNQKAEGKS